METSTFILEKDFAKQGFTHVIGTDEVGRGPLCGPVLACAAMLKDQELAIRNQELGENEEQKKMWDLVRDSKKLSEKQRELVFDFISEHFYIGIGLCDHETIDRINILEASFLSMKKAIQDLQRNIKKENSLLCHSRGGGNPGSTQNNIECENKKVTETSRGWIPSQAEDDTRMIILVDGNKVIPNLSMEQYAVIGGDKLVKSISAASIIAKVTRDRMMEEFHLKYPQYGLDKHKGYGTKVHMEALAKYGPCPIHRKSFAPVTRLLRNAFKNSQ